MPTLTPEQRLALEKAGQAPIRLEDPETSQAYVLLRADLYERMRALAEEEIDPSLFEIDDFEPACEDPR
ncbi:MAG TPA: hypothetical protein VGY53_02805 [Isosphaeraceae bacterium]|jgi:hypothetical protein|nr:hypothetical protein [Isosphaeraceae bacterium]